jgi:sugar O-acyltransferase (sialic acid O-acetyltransferase NeuD family)
MGPLTPLYVVGAGGMGREALAVLRAHGREHEVAGFMVEDAFSGGAERVEGLPVRRWSEIAAGVAGARFVVAIGSPERKRIVAEIGRGGGTFETLVHPSVDVPPRVRIAEGCIVLAGAIFTTHIEVGAHTLINVGCTVSHDAVLGRLVTLAPGVHVAGWARVDDEASIGAGAVIIDRVHVGTGSVIGAGAVVTEDIPPGVLAVGVPARVAKQLA